MTIRDAGHGLDGLDVGARLLLMTDALALAQAELMLGELRAIAARVRRGCAGEPAHVAARTRADVDAMERDALTLGTLARAESLRRIRVSCAMLAAIARARTGATR